METSFWELTIVTGYTIVAYPSFGNCEWLLPNLLTFM
jgi:hypothetical protein